VIVRVSAEVFRTYLIDACRFNPLAPFLTIHPVSVYERSLCYLHSSGGAGAAVSAAGELFNVFKREGGRSEDVRQAVRFACLTGKVSHVCCFDGKLKAYYETFGFHVEARFPWCDALAPARWQAEWGQPDYLSMAYAPSLTAHEAAE
jgi:hypothetical protein